jgi:hypothetical protein
VPLGESGGAIGLEKGSAGEAAFLIEVVRDRGLAADVDAALMQQILHVAERERKPDE